MQWVAAGLQETCPPPAAQPDAARTLAQQPHSQPSGPLPPRLPWSLGRPEHTRREERRQQRERSREAPSPARLAARGGWARGAGSAPPPHLPGGAAVELMCRQQGPGWAEGAAPRTPPRSCRGCPHACLASSVWTWLWKFKEGFVEGTVGSVVKPGRRERNGKGERKQEGERLAGQETGEGPGHY